MYSKYNTQTEIPCFLPLAILLSLPLPFRCAPLRRSCLLLFSPRPTLLVQSLQSFLKYEPESVSVVLFCAVYVASNYRKGRRRCLYSYPPPQTPTFLLTITRNPSRPQILRGWDNEVRNAWIKNRTVYTPSVLKPKVWKAEGVPQKTAQHETEQKTCSRLFTVFAGLLRGLESALALYVNLSLNNVHCTLQFSKHHILANRTRHLLSSDLKKLRNQPLLITCVFMGECSLTPFRTYRVSFCIQNPIQLSEPSPRNTSFPPH